MCILLFFGCTAEQPPDADAPEPPAHSGVFRADVGTLTFNGDGNSLIVCFDEYFAKETGLSCGECEGTYVFKFNNRAYRYDKADIFEICVGGSYAFRNIWQETNENAICLALPEKTDETVKFIKT